MRKKVAHKKDKSLYDENGRWVEERGRIKGAIRRSFRLSPQMKEVMEDARVELPPKLNKNGQPGKRPQVMYKCAICGGLFPKQTNKSNNIQVDHIDPVVPFFKKEEEMTYDEIVRGIFCDKSNLQVLCAISANKNDGKLSCHRKKTNEENWIRKYVQKNYLDIQLSQYGKIIEEAIEQYHKYLAEKEEKSKKPKRKVSKK